MLREVQRVQLAPVDQAPAVVARSTRWAMPEPRLRRWWPQMPPRPRRWQLADGSASPDLMDRLYRPQALDVPVLVSRDGPIAAIDPRIAGAIAGLAGRRGDCRRSMLLAMRRCRFWPMPGPASRFWPCARPGCGCNSADGTVLFEKILDAGERYAVPPLEEPPVFRTGNSGSVYFVVNGQTYGPAAPGANVVKDIALSPDALTETFAAGRSRRRCCAGPR